MREVKNCIYKVKRFRTLMDATQPKSQLMVEFASDILDHFTRCQTRQAEVEKGIVDLVQMRTEVWEINDESGLEAFISEQDAESDLYYTKVEKIRSENLVIFENCKSIIARGHLLHIIIFQILAYPIMIIILMSVNSKNKKLLLMKEILKIFVVHHRYIVANTKLFKHHN